MIVPGSNLLATALTLIRQDTVGYLRFKDRTTDAAGTTVATYHPVVARVGSFQAIEKHRYEHFGLDFSREYALWYDPKAETQSPDRGTAPDRLRFGGTTWEVDTTTNWKPQDGWRGVLVVNLKVAA